MMKMIKLAIIKMLLDVPDPLLSILYPLANLFNYSIGSKCCHYPQVQIEETKA